MWVIYSASLYACIHPWGVTLSFTSAVDFHLTVIIYLLMSFGIYKVPERLCLDDAAQVEETAAPEVLSTVNAPKAGEPDADTEVGEKTEVKEHFQY